MNSIKVVWYVLLFSKRQGKINMEYINLFSATSSRVQNKNMSFGNFGIHFILQVFISWKDKKEMYGIKDNINSHLKSFVWCYEYFFLPDDKIAALCL